MINLRRSGLSGEYRGVRQGAEIVLRVDIGAQESLDIISGDLSFESSPGRFTFHHSFQTTGLVPEEQPNAQLVRGAVKVHRDDILDIARLDLHIPDEGELLATYTFYQLTQFGRQTAATFTFPLAKTSSFFRRVKLEVDLVDGIPSPEPFRPDTHPDTPSDVGARVMTFESAFRDTGVDLVVTSSGQHVPVNLAGFDGLWTDEELHAAMVENFALHRDEPQWRLYLLLATRYVSSGVLGIMFDSGDDFPRQGAAVFHEHPAIAEARDAERNREYLYTIVHELGHAFNLLHSFQKGIFESHGVLPRPTSLSWMNYPQLFPFGYAGPAGWDGSGSFWSQFHFQFDREELAHLRHNDALEVMMGGRSFGFAGHLEERPFEAPSTERDLSLLLWLPQTVEFMQQVEGDVRLRNESREPVPVQPNLHPAAGCVELMIRRPGDRYPKVYRHFTHACVRADLQILQPGDAVYQELSPSFGLRHWFFDDPGTYEVQAAYHAPDGRRMISNLQRVRVLMPSAEADRAAPDFFTPDTGMYLGVEGSRIEGMRKEHNMLEELRQRLPQTEIAKQIGVTNALRDMRVFKDVRAGRVVRPDHRVGAADALLQQLGVRGGQKAVKVDPTRSHLRLARYLRTAAQSCMGEDKQHSLTVIDIMKNFLAAVKAPKQATEDLRSFAKHLDLKYPQAA